MQARSVLLEDGLYSPERLQGFFKAKPVQVARRAVQVCGRCMNEPIASLYSLGAGSGLCRCGVGVPAAASWRASAWSAWSGREAQGCSARCTGRLALSPPRKLCPLHAARAHPRPLARPPARIAPPQQVAVEFSQFGVALALDFATDRVAKNEVDRASQLRQIIERLGPAYVKVRGGGGGGGREHWSVVLPEG